MTNPECPAFPVTLDPNGKTAEAWATLSKSVGGLTKREYFAALAMQGLHAMYSHPGTDILTYSQKVCAKQAVIMADALITALDK